MSVTTDRTEANSIPGAHCHFCGDDTAPLVMTPCCGQLICCDTSYLSYRGGDYCQFEHENESIGRIPRLPVKIKHLNYPNRDTDKQVKRAEPILGFTIRRIGNEKRLAKFAQ